MNISLTNIGTDTYKNGSVLAGNLPILQSSGLNGLKSTQEKMERQQKTQNEVSFWEKQKENLKEHECETPEEIAEKLKTLHGYEDEIAAAKKAYNNEQMWHAMDEARELGEKIAEAAKDMEPKTAEERRKDAVEEAMGTDEDKSTMEEMMDDVSDLAEDAKAVEENAKELEELTKQTEDMQEEKQAQDALEEQAVRIQEQKQEQELEEEKLAARTEMRNLEAYQTTEKNPYYRGVDVLV